MQDKRKFQLHSTNMKRHVSCFVEKAGFEPKTLGSAGYLHVAACCGLLEAVVVEILRETPDQFFDLSPDSLVNTLHNTCVELRKCKSNTCDMA